MPGLDLPGSFIDLPKINGALGELKLHMHRQAQEQIVSADVGRLSDCAALFAVTTQGKLHIVNLDELKTLNTMQLQNPCSLVRAFKDFPDFIFLAVQQNQQYFLHVQTPSVLIESQDFPHMAPITDIMFAQIKNQNLVFTSAQDKKLRVFELSKVGENFKLTRIFEQATGDIFVTKFLVSPTNPSFLIGAQSDGNFVGWDLTNNQFMPTPGHDNNR
eukprot:CAMPEP_0170480032 /NCGR_PEP_ID=MMETSP0208-20121228/1026_1 /TAXON_ID=197538 /ORGANISM="Strombidium inclinatum, Strain S3" /LENGTH=215 /DNA_ID=CAMNT_0010752509 /DNA_START=551 /DNA_END=1198 /DNA_ORIENTATION=+